MDTEFGRFGSGRAVRRVEDRALLAGEGQFTGDFAPQGETHLVFLRSPHAHARIVSIDTAPALEVPGVLAVLTGQELAAAGVKPMTVSVPFKRPDGAPLQAEAQTLLATGEVRFVGEPVAAVVAETMAAARDGADAIWVEYDELPSVTVITRAAEDPARIVAQTRYGDPAAAQAGFDRAAHVVAVEIANQRLAPAPMEPRVVLAEHDAATGRLTVRLSSQMPSTARDQLVDLLNLEKGSLRVVIGDVGGGFGMKTNLYPEDAVVAFAARRLGRPVKWAATRIEDFLSAVHGRDVESQAEMALDADGKVLALRVRGLANVGAYPRNSGIAIQLLIGPWVSTSIYDIQTIDFTFTALMTNTAPTGAYRGAGRPEAIYIIERLMDVAARRMGLDPAELRRRNMIGPEQMPYRNAMGQTYDSGAFAQMLDQGLELADWGGYEARVAASAARGKLRGRGLATFLEWTGGNALEERVTVAVKGDGGIEIYATTQQMGQGIATSYAQLAVDVFDVPLEKITIVMGDSDRGTGFGSAGSRSLFTAGSAVSVASGKAVDEGKERAAEALEVAVADVEYQAGRFRVVGTDREIGLFEVAAKQPEGRIFIDSTTKVDGPTWPNGCHVCEVEIDRDTGEIDVVSYVSVNDAGRVVNPMIVEGQIQGGALQGLGQAICEQMVYDPESGQPLSASFQDYCMPRADVLQAGYVTALDQTVPCRTNPLGVKGVGELGTIGATPALVNAVADALAREGRTAQADRLQMPLTPPKVWALLEG
ncbi:xanthine dehydrogenase family protein molybdopterin-binding subunit [Roseococcus sp. SYP-B2431]|uniref:xanthine dehydrogenase family protein molybdopterin-binding subunit n=1 Tax=Roseococcus sp. SYP-B2431 TaxID=2496640 RepID=UPI00103B14F4|nr:xanthine dehydrogenase family protein molybdopterin-binding subunit [Roseococcus sp. SYP-B2431]TCH97031.1 xanthine dehydrogenase family protein molybdopterin-binding subunit [Roseococcus sp. SYP-B2431]